MTALNQQALANLLRVFGGNCIPPEGPQAIPIVLPFDSTAQEFEANLTITQQQHKISYIQSIYVDNSLNAVALDVFIPSTQHLVTVPPYYQGYIALLCSNPPSIIFASAVAGPVNVVVQLLNFPVSNILWNTDPSNANSPITVTDPTLDSLLANGYLPVLSQELGQGSVIKPQVIGSRTLTGTKANTGSTTILAVTDYFRITGITMGLTANASLAAPGLLTVSLRQGTSAFATWTPYLPGAAGTPATPQDFILVDRPFDYWSTTQGDDITLNFSAALATGQLWYVINYAELTIVGP